DPPGCRQCVLLIDLGRRTEVGQIVSESTAGWAQLLGNSLEIARDSIRRRPGSSNRRLDLLGGPLEKVPHGQHGDLLFASSECVESAFGAVQLSCEVVHREMAKSLR